jgi:predicted PurR-regulated permease PerM
MNQQQKLAQIKNAREPIEAEPKAVLAEDWDETLRVASRWAILGIFFVVAIVALYLGRSVLMPVSAAVVIGITLSPIQRYAEEYRIPRFLSAALIVLLFVGSIWAAIWLAAGPLTEWASKAPELGTAIQDKMRLLDRPLAMMRDLQNALTGAATGVPKQTVAVEPSPAAIASQAIVIITPALTELVVFFGTLLFLLVGINRMRRQLIVFFSSRDARLTVVRIWRDIEKNLVTYLATVTVINIGLGIATAVMLWLLGFPNPIAFGVLISVMNYLPYIGAAIFVTILFIIGLIALPTVGGALLAPALFVTIATIEGQLITPAIVGHRLTMSPFLVFLALAFWAWLWGPMGAFMATPFLIISLVVIEHLFSREDHALPG